MFLKKIEVRLLSVASTRPVRAVSSAGERKSRRRQMELAAVCLVADSNRAATVIIQCDEELSAAGCGKTSISLLYCNDGRFSTGFFITGFSFPNCLEGVETP